jgi:hypothetical protein
MPVWFMSSMPALALLLLLAGAPEAGARPPTEMWPAAQPQDAAAPTRPGRRKPRIVHLPSPSQESPEQRDRRLMRECRGLPNAGACLGYAAARPRGASARR